MQEFLKIAREFILDIELFMQNTFNPVHGYKPKEDNRKKMIEELMRKIKDANKRKDN